MTVNNCSVGIYLLFTACPALLGVISCLPLTLNRACEQSTTSHEMIAWAEALSRASFINSLLDCHHDLPNLARLTVRPAYPPWWAVSPTLGSDNIFWVANFSPLIMARQSESLTKNLFGNTHWWVSFGGLDYSITQLHNLLFNPNKRVVLVMGMSSNGNLPLFDDEIPVCKVWQ